MSSNGTHHTTWGHIRDRTGGPVSSSSNLAPSVMTGYQCGRSLHKNFRSLHKNFQEDHLNSRRYPGGFSNSRRFPGFPGVVDTLIAHSKYQIQGFFKDFQGPTLAVFKHQNINEKPYPTLGASKLRLQCDTEVCSPILQWIKSSWQIDDINLQPQQYCQWLAGTIYTAHE